MTPNLSNRRPDDYGPIDPWKRPPMTDADIKDRLKKLMAAATMAADFTPDDVDNQVYGALSVLAAERKFVRAIRAVAEALPQHRAAVAQQLFGEGM